MPACGVPGPEAGPGVEEQRSVSKCKLVRHPRCFRVTVYIPQCPPAAVEHLLVLVSAVTHQSSKVQPSNTERAVDQVDRAASASGVLLEVHPLLDEVLVDRRPGFSGAGRRSDAVLVERVTRDTEHRSVRLRRGRPREVVDRREVVSVIDHAEQTAERYVGTNPTEDQHVTCGGRARTRHRHGAVRPAHRRDHHGRIVCRTLGVVRVTVDLHPSVEVAGREDVIVERDDSRRDRLDGSENSCPVSME